MLLDTQLTTNGAMKKELNDHLTAPSDGSSTASSDRLQRTLKAQNAIFLLITISALFLSFP